ncbi:MAG: adenylosuccinate lyase family protein [Silicimonas sp.]|nr:adenylosuccinate lyase family protein [Silicimonas sp.]
MTASPADSAIYRNLFGDADIARLFSDTAEVRAMMLALGALAKAQGAHGLIPETAATAIHRASMELQLDPGGLADSVARNAVPVPKLVEMFRDAMQAPDHAQFLHWGATSQDIMETALALRLRQALGIIETRLSATTASLARLADHHAETPMVARTYGQAAVLTSFGAHVAAWGNPLLRQRDRLAPIRDDVAMVSLSGAAGTLSVMGAAGPAVRAALADALDLTDPEGPRHSQRDAIATLAGWLTTTTGVLAKMGEDLLILTQSGRNEVRLATGGASSTMPQKANPVLPSLLVAIHRQAIGLNTAIQSALPHRQERDAAAWMVEWMSLPGLVTLAARALAAAHDLADQIDPDADRMQAHIDATEGMIFAEALTFALAATIPRPEAQAAVKALVAKARTEGTGLADAARTAHPDLDLASVFDPAGQLGEAPAIARAFAKRARD